MATDGIDLVLRFRRAVEEDLSAVDGLLASEVEWVLPAPVGTLRGIDAVREFFAPSEGAGYDHLDVTEQRGELEDLGAGRVAATNRIIWRWKETGEVSHESSMRIKYTIRDGKIVRFEAAPLTSGS